MSHPPVAMVAVRLVALSGTEREGSFSRDDTLRDVQKRLCGLFLQRFPKTKATLVYKEEIFDDFCARPFEHCQDHSWFTIVFKITDDMFFFDQMDRCGLRPTLEEEALYVSSR